MTGNNQCDTEITLHCSQYWHLQVCHSHTLSRRCDHFDPFTFTHSPTCFHFSPAFPSESVCLFRCYDRLNWAGGLA